MDVGHNQVGPAFQIFPLLGPEQVIALVGQLAHKAAFLVCHQLFQGRGHRFPPLFRGPLPVKPFDHLGKALLGQVLGVLAQMAHGHEGKVHIFLPTAQQGGLVVPFLHPAGKVHDLCGQSFFPAPAPVPKLPGDEGGHQIQLPGEGFGPLFLGKGFFRQGPGFLLCQGQQAAAHRPGRHLVAQPGQDGPLGRHFAVHLFQAAQNGAVSRKQNQVVPPACQLHHQGFFRQLSEIVIGGKPEPQHPLMLRLAHFQKPGGGEVLAQQHAEHGGRIGVFGLFPGEIHPAPGAGAGNHQFPGPPMAAQGQNDLLPAGHEDLIHPAVRKLLLQLAAQAVDGDGVHGHILLILPEKIKSKAQRLWSSRKMRCSGVSESPACSWPRALAPYFVSSFSL